MVFQVETQLVLQEGQAEEQGVTVAVTDLAAEAVELAVTGAATTEAEMST